MFFCAGLAHTQDLPVAPYLPAQGDPTCTDAPITLQYPQENMTVSKGAKNIYLFGKVHLPQATLDINGQATPLHKNGTFIAYIPVEQGPFEITLTAKNGEKTYQAVRHITVPGEPIEHFTAKARFDESEVYPSLPLWVLPGEVINLSVRGTPGAHVTAELPKLKDGKKIELRESTRTPGLYTGKYLVREKEKPRTVKVIYTLQDPATKSKTKVTAKERVKVLNPQEPLQSAQVTDPGVKLRQIPVHQGSLYPHYRAYGNVQINGRDNGLYRLRLSDTEQAWLEESKLSTPSASSYSPNELRGIHTRAEDSVTQARWNLLHPATVSVHEFNNRLEITFYGLSSFEENFDLDTTSPLLERIEEQNSDSSMHKFTLYFKTDQPLWGYGYRYEGNDFVLDLHHRPQRTPQKDKPLSGVRILLDAGHSPKRKPPYDGLVTPSGHLEYEETLALAELLKAKLEQSGATVIMTRAGQNHFSLPERYRKAIDENAHIFVSLHYNALPDTVDPFAAPRGYSVYYSYPHSFKLAESVYKAFNKTIPLADNGLIANDVLFIPRIPEMPSILVESAFLIVPEQEDWVIFKQGRQKLAEALYQGILDFYGVKQPTNKKAKRR